MDLGLKGKRAVVLASSGGLGRATALELAREGARVVVCSRDFERADAAADAIAEETGAETHAFACDVASEDSLATFFDEALGVLGGLDVLVTNAGGPPPGRFADMDEGDWERTFQLTLQSVVRSVRLAVPHLREAGGGSILALASSSVVQPIPNLLMSNVFRPAVYALCNHLSEELASDGVRVNVLSPGRIQTERIEELDRDRAQKTGTSVEEVRAETVARIPLARIGRTDEFGRVAAFLSSEAASYLTGQHLLVDGGLVRSL